MLVVILLAACGASSTPIPNSTPIPTQEPTQAPTPTIVPATTITPTTGPENISDAKELPEWLDEFVHAFDGKIHVSGKEMDSGQLTDEIRLNENKYIIEKQINGIDIQFLIIQGFPLAVRQGDGQWQEVTMKNLGTLVNLKIGSLISNNENLRSWWGKEFHMGTITLGLREAMPNNTSIDFGWPDYQTQIAIENKMETKLHAGLFPAGAPLWMKYGFTQDDLDTIVRLEVEFAKKYQLDEIVVVNEARIPADWVTPDIYWQKFGIDYVIRAFRIARELYPEAKLIYNDTANHKYGTFGTETTRLISNALFEEDLIDYVGVQMHIDPDQYPNKEEMIGVFRNYPVPVQITELDFSLPNISPSEYNAKLNEIIRIVFEGCLESEVCVNITTWGENDSVGWGGRTLLRDFDNNRKQAYYVAMQTMFEHLP